MFKKTFVALCLGTFSVVAQGNALSDNNVQHDPQQCPVDIDGYYKVAGSSDMNFRISRDLNNNLVMQFIISGGLAGQPTIAHGRYAPVNSVKDDGTPFVLGHTVSYCKDSAIYSRFISKDESLAESNTNKLTAAPNAIQVQQVAPTVSDIKVWPRTN